MASFIYNSCVRNNNNNNYVIYRDVGENIEGDNKVTGCACQVIFFKFL